VNSVPRRSFRQGQALACDIPARSASSGSGLEVGRLRAIHRAVADLRQGVPVVLTGPAPLLALAAETARTPGLVEFSSLAGGPALAVVAPARAGALLQRSPTRAARAVALRLPDAMLTPEALHGLADPTAEQIASPFVEAPVPVLGPAALAFAKLGRLMPAMLVAPVLPQAAEQVARLGLLSVAAADILAFPTAAVLGLRRVAQAEVPLDGAADTRVVGFRSDEAGTEHFAILVGQPETAAAPLVRVHSQCFTGDLLGSLRCDCGPQLRGAIRRMAEAGAGALLYLAQEGRGIGLMSKLRAYALQDQGLDTLDANRALGWDADERDFLVAATMLKALGLPRIRLLTNNPAKVAALAACGVQIVSRESHAFAPNGVNNDYLATKAERFGHLLD
jgi:GTP cyclohydrolase II